MRNTSVYFRIVFSIAVFLAIVFTAGAAAAFVTAAFLPVRVFSPEGDGSGGEGGGTDETVTITKKEYDEMKTKFFRNGHADGKKKASESFSKLLETAGINLLNDSIEETITSLSEQLKKSSEGKDQQVSELEAKLQAALRDNNVLKEEVNKSKIETADFIVNTELTNVLASKVHNAQAAALFIRQGAKIERLKDGTIRLYDKSGNQIFDDKGDPIGLGAYVDQFLNQPENSFLVKSNQTAGGTGGGEQTGVPKNLHELAERDPNKMTAEQRKQFLESVE